MGMTLLAGRDLSEQDGPEAPPVALINETLARAHFDGTRSAVGKTFRFENETVNRQVVGVVGDVHHPGPRDEVSPYIYYPHAQNPSDLVTLTIRTLVPPATLAEPVRRVIGDVERSLNVQAIATLEQQFDGVIRRELLLARLTGAFGVLALALTCVGLYGLLAYSVARRTNEIGLRMALGAQRRTILAGVLRETVVLVAVGSSAGLAAALAASRLLESQLYEVAPNDPATIAAAAAVVLLVGLLAAGLPARRAARIEPMQALRYD
jgi:predicted permease